MSIGLIGRKCGMSRLYTEEGAIPVTLVEVKPNTICQIKTLDSDGYQSLQVSVGIAKASRVNKPVSGHYKKSGIELGKSLWEFRLSESADLSSYQLGQSLTLDLFKAGQKIDVTGTSKGKGFAGVIKRHNFATQDASHGNSVSHRVPGSIGQRQTPGRVFKGKKMAGHLGNVKCTIQTLEIVRIDLEKNLVLIKGSIPGAQGGNVIIKPATKAGEIDNAD